MIRPTSQFCVCGSQCNHESRGAGPLLHAYSAPVPSLGRAGTDMRGTLNQPTVNANVRALITPMHERGRSGVGALKSSGGSGRHGILAV